MREYLENYGYIIDSIYKNGKYWVKKRYGINLICSSCGRTIYEGWTNGWNIYCDECFKNRD